MAVVDAAGVVHYRAVETGRDDGANVEIASGLKAGENVVIGPSDDVKDGARVKAIPFKED